MCSQYYGPPKLLIIHIWIYEYSQEILLTKRSPIILIVSKIFKLIFISSHSEFILGILNKSIFTKNQFLQQKDGTMGVILKRYWLCKFHINETKQCFSLFFLLKPCPLPNVTQWILQAYVCTSIFKNVQTFKLQQLKFPLPLLAIVSKEKKLLSFWFNSSLNVQYCFFHLEMLWMFYEITTV